MQLLRAFDNTSRPMQRLGFMKYLIHRCSQQTIWNLRSLGEELTKTVAQKITVNVTPALYAYIRKRLTDNAYSVLKRKLANVDEDNLESMTVPMELQDVYLADEKLPSRTGKLVAADWRKYPLLATSLGLMRKESYSLLVRGLMLIQLISQNELDAFKQYLPASNPFILDISQKLFFLFAFLEFDGDVLKALYANLLSLNQEFTDRDAGDYLPEIYHTLEKQARRRVRSADDRMRLERMLDMAASIEKWKERSYSGESARGHAITVRLEPLVDLEFLSKVDPFAYNYSISEPGKLFFDAVTQTDDIGDFLHSSFFAVCNETYKLGAKQIENPDDILAELYRAYNCLKSPVGYAPIIETALLASITAITERNIYFEIDESISVMKQLQKEQPHFIRFNIDRMGNLTYVKFVDAPSGVEARKNL